MSEQPIQQPQRHRRRSPVPWLIGIAVVIVFVASAFLAWRDTVRTPTALDYTRLANRVKFAKLWGVVWPVLSLFIVIGLLLSGLGIALAAVRWLNRLAGESHARNGIFPVRTTTLWTWEGQVVVIHDPNRAPTATTIYHPKGTPLLEARYEAPDHVSPDQVRITSQAQVAQVAGALPADASGPLTQRIAGTLPEVASPPVGELPLLRPDLPDVEDWGAEGDGHIDRLLEEQGELPHTIGMSHDG